ncbi:hypothetical protein Slin14017_G077370 [Septoria linicola]|nr:hypothetical protein Slin14017_G077370 [Septoria linicola]
MASKTEDVSKVPESVSLNLHFPLEQNERLFLGPSPGAQAVRTSAKASVNQADIHHTTILTLRELARQCRQTLSIVEQAQELRSRLENASQKYQEARASFHEAGQATEEISEQVAKDQLSSNIKSDLWNNLCTSVNNLTVQDSQLRRHEDEITHNAQQLATTEMDLSRSLQAFIQSSELSLSLDVASSGDLMHSDTDPGEDPILLDYYSKLADEEIMAERLQTLDYDYHEERIVRTLREDQGRISSIADHEFELSWEAEFHAAREAHQRSAAAAEAAYELCRKSGVLSSQELRELPINSTQPTSEIQTISQRSPMIAGNEMSETAQPPHVASLETLQELRSVAVSPSYAATGHMNSTTGGGVVRLDVPSVQAAVEQWLNDTPANDDSMADPEQQATVSSDDRDFADAMEAAAWSSDHLHSPIPPDTAIQRGGAGLRMSRVRKA